MKLVLAAAGLVFLLVSCGSKPEPQPQHYYTQRTIYYTPKTNSTSTPAYRKYGGGESRTYSGNSGGAESFRATTR